MKNGSVFLFLLVLSSFHNKICVSTIDKIIVPVEFMQTGFDPVSSMGHKDFTSGEEPGQDVVVIFYETFMAPVLNEKAQ